MHTHCAHYTHVLFARTAELRWLVLDEADRLLDLGFEARLRDIVASLDKRTAEVYGEEVRDMYRI